MAFHFSATAVTHTHLVQLRLIADDVFVGDVQLECSPIDEGLLTEGTFVDEALVLVEVVRVDFGHRNAFVAQFTFLQPLLKAKTSREDGGRQIIGRNGQQVPTTNWNCAICVASLPNL